MATLTRSTFTPAFTCLRVVPVLIWTLSVAPAWSQQIPIPDEAAQQEALTLFTEAYKSEFDEAKSSEQRIALAKKMLHQGVETKNEPASQYVLLRVAQDVAGKAGDVHTAFQAIAAMQKSFPVDALTLKIEVLAAAAKTLRAAEEQQRIIAPASALIDEAIATDNYAAAKALGEITIVAARRAKDSAVIKQVVRRNEELDRIAMTYAKSKAARELLSSKPTDPSANATVGKFYCFAKGDWVTGIPMLALGNDDELKPLAIQELEPPADPLALGDAWWELAEPQEEAMGQRIRQHAIHWYKKAVPALTGLSKAKIEKRIGDAAATDFLVASREVTAYKTFRPNVDSTLRLQPENVGERVLAAATTSPLKNGSFLEGLSSWRCEGDVTDFRISNKGWISTYGSTKKEAARGRLSQTFVVPNDASKLRFELHGGRGNQIFVALKSDGAEVKRTTGRNNNTPHTVEWEIQTSRGKAVEFEIVDHSNGRWQFIGVGKIELVRSDN